MAGAVVTPAGGQPVNLKSALKKGSTRRKRQVVIDEARNTYCEATSYFYEDVPLPRRRDLALKKGAQQKTGEDSTSAATMTAVSLPSEPRGKGALHGRDGVVKKNPMDKAPPEDGGETNGSEKGYKRVPSSDTLVTALLTDSLLALTSSSGPRGDNHQFWRPNLPDLVTESVEGDSGKGDSSPEETRGSPVGDDSAEAPANTFRVIKADDQSTDSGDAGTDLDQQGPDPLVATSTTANEAPSVTVSEPVSPKFSEIVAERPISVLITDTETDSDAIDSPRKPSNTKSQTMPNDNFAKSSSLPALNTSVNSSVSEPSEPGSPSSDTDLSALSNADSPDRFWKLSPGTRRIDDFPASPATSSGSSASSSPPAWDRSPSGSPPRRSPPSLASLDVSRESAASRESGASPDSPPSPPDSPPPALADDGYSLDDIEDALRDEPPSPAPAPAPASTSPPSAVPPVRQEPVVPEERPAQQQRGPEEGVCVEEELAGFVEGQTERTERLRRRYAAAEDGGFIRRPSVRGVVIQQGPAGHQQQQAYQQPIYQQHQQQMYQQQQQQQYEQQQQQQQLFQRQQQQEQMYWQQQQQQRQPPAPSGAQHSQLHRQHSLQPRPLGPPAQMAPPSASHTRQQSAPMLVRPGVETEYQRPPMERPQQREEMYVTVRPGEMRPAEMHPERLGPGQHQRQVAPPPQQGRGYQPPPPPPGQVGQIPQYSAPMQQLPAPVQQQRSAPIHQQQQQQQQQQYQHVYQPSGPGPSQQPLQNRPQPGFNNPASQLQPPQQQQQQHYQQQNQQQYQQQQQYNQQNQQQQQQAAVARPVPMGQTRQQQLEQIRRLQSNHMVRVPAVTVGFPDETSRRQVSHWNAPAWLPSAGGVRGGARERESFRAGRQRSASQQRLEAVGRPASLALPRASEWPQDRAPPPGGVAPPQPPPRFCEPSVAPPAGAAVGPGSVTLPRRFAASPEVTGSLPRHQRLSSASGWPGDGPPPPPPQPYPPPPSQQAPAPGASRWYERSAPMQTSSGTARGAPPPHTRTRPPPQAEPLYVQRPPARGVSLEDLSADECDV